MKTSKEKETTIEKIKKNFGPYPNEPKIHEVEKANYDIRIETNKPIFITLDKNFKGKISIQIKNQDGLDGTLRIPVEFTKEDIDSFKCIGLEVYEHCGINLWF